MKMLMFDFRESENYFFEKREFKDLDITFIKEPLNEYTKLTDKQLEETEIISVFISSKVTSTVLKKFKNLRIIATRSTGFSHIDTKYCMDEHIAVCNVENYGQTSVAQYTIAMILTLVRKFIPAYTDMQRGIIDHSRYEGQDINNMTLGIIGAGAIGSTVAKIASYMGMNVLVSSYAKRNDVEAVAEYVPIDELVSKSDIITLHLPYTTESYHILGQKEFEQMKRGIYIINTARGELIDIVALYENILSGKVLAAALDVTECEYLSETQNNLIHDIKSSNSNCVTNALITQKMLAMENVIITPHIAYNTKESVEVLLETTFNNILDYYKGLNIHRVC